MKKILNHKYWWLFAVVIFVTVVLFSSLFNQRLDLTKEKRFSLTKPTKELLSSLDSTVHVQVFLSGELPADYKKLSQSVNDLLRDFRDASNNLITISFEQPGEALDDSSKYTLYDSLSRLGVVFERTEQTSTTQEKQTAQLIIPSALVHYGNKKPIAVDLRSSKKVFKTFSVVSDQPQEDVEATRNAAEALLEYKFANAIDKLTRKYVPSVGYLIGNGEPIDPRINDLGESLRNEYRLALFNLKQGYPSPEQLDALLVVKPTEPFTEEDKLKLDQYVMHGGKIIWFVDKLYAELDSLMRAKQPEFVAYDRGLNLDDILFKYGVRINTNLLQDMQCSNIQVVVGQNPDGSPRMQPVPWPYYPLLSSRSENPISKNIDRVLPSFPSTIDTVKAPGITKTVLLASDTNSRIIASPALVSMNNVFELLQSGEFGSFNKSHVPVAVLLEGKFTSLYANRISQVVKDSVQKALNKPFSTSSQPTKQIVVADADIVTNVVSQTSGPQPMGMPLMDNYRYANREFFLNAVDYLVSNNGIFAARNKSFTLRLLDREKTEREKTKWQLINVGGPIVAVMIFGLIFPAYRKRKFTANQSS